MVSVGGVVRFVDNPSLCMSEVDAFLSGGVSYGGEWTSGVDDGC